MSDDYEIRAELESEEKQLLELLNGAENGFRAAKQVCHWPDAEKFADEMRHLCRRLELNEIQRRQEDKL